jgi:beta-glucosidase-like glycosyl hydrolase
LNGEDLVEGIHAPRKHFISHGFSQGGVNWGPVHLHWQEINKVFMSPFQARLRIRLDMD